MPLIANNLTVHTGEPFNHHMKEKQHMNVCRLLSHKPYSLRFLDDGIFSNGRRKEERAGKFNSKIDKRIIQPLHTSSFIRQSCVFECVKPNRCSDQSDQDLQISPCASILRLGNE